MLQIKTKVFVPQVRDTLVHRPRLVSRICAGTQHALTLLSAPPGFGKTTALAEWAAGKPIPLAWISLDAGDNAPARFLAYLLYALDLNHLSGAENAALLQSIESLPSRVILERLSQDLEAIPEPFAVVLDDYHLITAQPVHECITFLLDHMPPQMHLVIATRADPPIPLARLRARGELLELRADELRFTAEEAAVFLDKTLGLSLNPEEVELLDARTEGWIAGLQLAALSMHGRKDVHGFIQAFSGSHRFILDYLLEEVINQQPEHIQQFLLRTSMLERLNGPLCDALTRDEQRTGHNREDARLSSQSILEYLDKSNLFLVPLDDDRHWYRYHHLFAELLQAQLKQTNPGLIPGLHLRAAGWLEQNGFRTEAVQHALSAGDAEYAAQLIEQHGQESWSFSDLTFLMLIGQLPLEALRAHPKLGFYSAWMLITQGQLEAAEARLRDLEQWMKDEPGDPEIQGIHGFIRLLFTYLAVLSGKVQHIELPSVEVLEVVPEQFLAMRNSADVVYAMLLSFRGDFDAAVEILRSTVRRDLAANGTTATPISIALFARLRTLQGRLHEAADLCRKYLQVVAERGMWRFYLAGDLNIVLGEVLREWNELDEAERQIRAGIQTNEPWNIAQGTAIGRIGLARLQQARGELDAALHTLDEAERLIAGSTLTPDLASELRNLRISFELARGGPAGSGAWAAQLPDRLKSDYRGELDFIMLARWQLKQGKTVEAELLLQQLSQQAEAGGRILRQAKIDLLWAQALLAQKKIPQALEKLESCLSLGEPEGFVRTFLDEGEPARELISLYLRSTAPRHRVYAAQLLEAFPTAAPKTPSATTQAGLVEPLTQRELEVLQLICAGKSNQEICEALTISLNTVKRHNNSIFSKLGVSNRAQAIVRAQEMKLVQSSSLSKS